MKNLPLLQNVGLPEVSLTFPIAVQHCELLYNHLFAVTAVLILALYFHIFVLSLQLFRFLTVFVHFSETKFILCSDCFQTPSTFLCFSVLLVQQTSVSWLCTIFIPFLFFF